jgi:hypothetical protein
MEGPTPIYESEPPAAKGKMAPWLIVLLIVLGACAALIVIPICVIFILALLGPAIGNIFSNIISSI